MTDNQPRDSAWVRFWHEPVRAERLAVTRILFAVALLTDQLFQYLPHLLDFFGPHGVAPAGLFDRWQVRDWRWTILLFNTDDPTTLYTVFFLWVAITIGFLVGWWTRFMNVGVWFLTLCFINRNSLLLNGGDDTLMCGLFLLMLTPSGKAFSLDSWLRRRRGKQPEGPAFVPGWTVRLLQIQLCLIYLSTGLVKLQGTGPLEGTWWDGTSIHYVLNYVTMSRWSFAQLPVPIWLTAIMTYTSVAWEVLFTALVLHPRTRRWALWFGVAFHLGIWFTIEVGWFSFYTLAFYGAWIPGEFWDRIRPWVARLRRARETRSAELAAQP